MTISSEYADPSANATRTTDPQSKRLRFLQSGAYNMEYEWDRAKARSNVRKHGVDFADAATVFNDDFAITVPGDDLEEERFITIGMDALARVLVVVYAWREEDIRIISARKANKRERLQYEGQL